MSALQSSGSRQQAKATAHLKQPKVFEALLRRREDSSFAASGARELAFWRLLYLHIRSLVLVERALR